MQTTEHQVRILFKKSGRIGIFSFSNKYHARNVFWNCIEARDLGLAVDFRTVNGLCNLDGKDISMVMLVN